MDLVRVSTAACCHSPF
ncbi:hypothetical protein [Rhodococcus gordoniae]